MPISRVSVTGNVTFTREAHARGYRSMSEKTLPDVARDLGITNDKVRYWLSLLKAPVGKNGRVVMIPQESISLLSRMAGFVNDGFLPGEAAKRARGEASCVPVTVPIPTTPPAISPEISNRLESMEKAIMLLVDENRSLRGEVSELRKESAGLRLRLEAPPQEPQKPATPRTEPNLVVFRKIEEKPIQRDAVSAWEGIRLAFDDLLGFAFGWG